MLASIEGRRNEVVGSEAVEDVEVKEGDVSWSVGCCIDPMASEAASGICLGG